MTAGEEVRDWRCVFCLELFQNVSCGKRLSVLSRVAVGFYIGMYEREDWVYIEKMYKYHKPGRQILLVQNISMLTPGDFKTKHPSTTPLETPMNGNLC